MFKFLFRVLYKVLFSWIRAARLRTLPLSLSVVAVASALAHLAGAFDWVLAILLTSTVILLQVLSNFANDVGDSLHGIDHAGREGPVRVVQGGLIRPRAMRVAMFVVGMGAFVLGVCLLVYAFYGAWAWLLFFLVLGLLALWAAVAYAYGRRPYGHAGWGDLSVFIFFGLLGVGGSFFLYTRLVDGAVLCVAYAFGACAVAVLHLNNWRDRVADAAASKYSLAVRLGPAGSLWYYRGLLFSVLVALVGYTLLARGAWWWLGVLPFWGYAIVVVRVSTLPRRLNQQLRYMVFLTVALAVVLIAGWLYGDSLFS